jgi:hypothetical protein
MSLSSLRFSRLSRAGVAAVALAPALVLAAPAAVADDAEAPAADSTTTAPEDTTGDTTGDDATGTGEGATSGSLPEGIGSEDAASSLSDADWSKVAGVVSDIVGGGVSLDTILEIISLVNGDGATVGDVIGSVTGSLGGESGTGDTGTGDTGADTAATAG